MTWIPTCSCVKGTRGGLRPNTIMYNDSTFNTYKSDRQEQNFLKLLSEIKSVQEEYVVLECGVKMDTVNLRQLSENISRYKGGTLIRISEDLADTAFEKEGLGESFLKENKYIPLGEGNSEKILVELVYAVCKFKTGNVKDYSLFKHF